ncbi:hypothetical protein GUI12_02490 [Anaplasmataceae bacterium AB001_6]|nr:hypothetical protein GUI12_02490 [Anaplasmataceae bacterium AB001_6]
MKIKRRLLRSLFLVTIMSVVSLTTVSAASKKASSDGMQVDIFYSPSIVNNEIVISNPEGVNGLAKAINLKDNTNIAWLGGGAKVGYKMGDITISAVTDYRKTDYYLDNENTDLLYKVLGGTIIDSIPRLPKTATEGAYYIGLKDISKWYTGIDVEYVIGISKEISASVGIGAGVEYESINIQYATPENVNSTAETKLTALPFAMQGNASFGYEVSPGITPYVGYTLRYALETDLKPKDDAIKLLGIGDGTGKTVTPAELPMKLQSGIDHILRIGVNFAF